MRKSTIWNQHKHLPYFLWMLLLLPLKTQAWWDVGHQLIASIAYTQLNSDVKIQVDELAATLAREYPELREFTDLAVWPDTLRQNKIEAFTHWHYIDIPFSSDGTPIVNTVDTDNAVTMLTQINAIVANKHINVYERARFLAFLVHITGDLHQPLHTVSRLSKDHPKGDEGGNLFLVLNPDQPSQTMPLHALWDSNFGAFRQEAKPNIAELTNYLTERYPVSYFGTKPKNLKPEHWVKEGVFLAQKLVYNTEVNELPKETYLTNGKNAAEKRITLSGYRLANLLNQLLGQ